MAPSVGTPIKAAAIVSHGQGDFAERYINVLEPFTERGIMCIGTDLLGHGRSPGIRGHGGTLELVDAICRANLDHIGNLPYGLIGHSMGGLLTLRHYLIAHRGELPIPDFAWISSPLLNPTRNTPHWLVQLAMFFASVAPKVTINTGITPEMCRTSPAPNPDAQALKDQLGHRRISLGWVKELRQASQLVHSSFPKTHGPLLFTQGEADTVCPPELARQFCEPFPNITYKQFSGMLHEPFADIGSTLLFQEVSNWLDNSVMKTTL